MDIKVAQPFCTGIRHLTTATNFMKKSYTILYVDDDHDDLLLITEAFEQYTDHLKVVHADNGFEALQALAKMDSQGSLPCLIILDINMPIMDGKVTLSKIKDSAKYVDIPVVMFSTSSNKADKTYAENLGADFIIKPVTYRDMENLVSQFAQRCRLAVAS
jgi:CheY-like chemotaxis protein